jgi:hypothetical protein
LSLVHEIASFLIARHQQETPTPASNISFYIRVHPSQYDSTHLLLPSESNMDRRHACSIFPNCEKTASNSPLSAMPSVWPRNIPIDPFRHSLTHIQRQVQDVNILGKIVMRGWRWLKESTRFGRRDIDRGGRGVWEGVAGEEGARMGSGERVAR